MTLSEKSAYIKGLMEGMQLDTEKNEGKLLKAMVDLLGDMALTIGDLEDNAEAVSDELDMTYQSISYKCKQQKTAVLSTAVQTVNNHRFNGAVN